jgi:alpha-tubulin suppressor-like RCC1 family protein
VSVLNLTSATGIATSWQHSLAVRSDGTDRGWGLNKNGQLGDGSNTNRRSPVNVSGIANNAQP